MSKEFTTIRIDVEEPSKLKDPQYNGEVKMYQTNNFETVKSIGTAYTRDLVLGIPYPNGENYHRVFAECLVNQLQSLTQSMSKSTHKDDYMVDHPADRRNENGIPLEMYHQFRELSNVMQYMINCTSWKTGKYHNFDAMEIQSRISRVALMSNIALNR